MNIGIIGSGNVGKALGEAWLRKGHHVLFSYSRDLQKLRDYAAGLGGKASAGTAVEAVKFGEAILFAPPWPAKAFNTTGAENMRNPQFGSQRATMFICGDDAGAKSVAGGLAGDAGFEVVDAGALRIARLLEPLATLWIHLAYGQRMGTGFAFTLLRR